MTSTVTVAEGHILNLAQLSCGIVSASDVTRLLVTQVVAPEKMGPTSVHILKDTLARGVALTLARNAPLEQMHWAQKQTAPALTFTGNTLRLFKWILSTSLLSSKTSVFRFEGAVTEAEQVMIVSLIDSLVGTGCEWALLKQESIHVLPMVQLAYAFEVGRLGVKKNAQLPSVFYLESLHRLLVKCWLNAEQSKKDLSSAELLAGSTFQESVLANVVALASIHREAIEFVIDVLRLWLGTKPNESAYVPNDSSSLALRQQARRSAACVLRVASTTKAWDDEHRNTRFIDDGYERAQQLVKSWQRLTSTHYTLAAEIVSTLEGL
jgi:hypothetical protein